MSSSSLLSDSTSEYFIIGASIISILFGLFNAILILRIKIISTEDQVMAYKDDKHIHKYQLMQEIADLISDGANTFLV